MDWPDVASHKLSKDNHCLVYPVCGYGSNMELEPGWKLLGKGKAPYGRTNQSQAIVFEKTTPAVDSILDVLIGLDPGIYWCHGYTDTFQDLFEKEYKQP